MLRLTKLTDYAIVILSEMASNPAARLSSSQLAAATGVNEPTVAKILKQLTCAQMIGSHRGVQGGYQLLTTGDKITMRQIIEAIDGPIAIADCVNGATGCSVKHKCRVRGNWDKVNNAIIGALDGLTLGEMMQQQNMPVAAE
jgi:FeS assembly SUF system regulator